MNNLNLESLRTRVRAALQEDLGTAGDITTKAIFPPEATAHAVVVAKEAGIFCGSFLFTMVFDCLEGVTVTLREKDGTKVLPAHTVIELNGPVRSLLAGERTALNFIQHLSGIATATRRMVDAAGGRIAVCDTRKTTPLWRDVEKYAVRTGGGANHRMGLYDMVMIKDTHADGAGSLAEALRRVAHLRPDVGIAAEARTLDEVQMALDGGADLIMLDNMPVARLREAVALIGGRVPTEITGGITLERLHELVELRIDRVSSGALTHSVKALDFSMRLRGDSRT